MATSRAPRRSISTYKISRLAARARSAASLPAASSWTSSTGTWVAWKDPTGRESCAPTGQSGIRRRKLMSSRCLWASEPRRSQGAICRRRARLGLASPSSPDRLDGLFEAGSLSQGRVAVAGADVVQVDVHREPRHVEHEEVECSAALERNPALRKGWLRRALSRLSRRITFPGCRGEACGRRFALQVLTLRSRTAPHDHRRALARQGSTPGRACPVHACDRDRGAGPAPAREAARGAALRPSRSRDADRGRTRRAPRSGRSRA